MEALPVISVVTPSFNQGRYLEQTILSVLAQGYPALEYIVMDGGSRDNSLEIIKRYQGRLSSWVSEKDQGQSDALRRGFEKSRGEILCWLNSDDMFLPGALLKVAAYFQEHPEAEAVNGGGYFVDEQGAPLRFGVIGFTRGVAAGFNRFKYYGSDGLYQPSVFWRRHAYFEVGGVDAGLRFAMDRDLETRLARRLTLGRIPDFLSASRVHSNTKTATLQKICAQEMELLMDRYGARNKARWKQALFYAWHRLDSLARKAAWITQKWFGVFRLERVYFPPEESGLTGAGK